MAYCEQCKCRMTQKSNESNTRFKRRRFCSRRCSAQYSGKNVDRNIKISNTMRGVKHTKDRRKHQSEAALRDRSIPGRKEEMSKIMKILWSQPEYRAKQMAARANWNHIYRPSKSETLFLNRLENIVGVVFDRQFMLEGRKFDGHHGTILIEVDSTYWHDPDKREDMWINDMWKSIIASKNGFALYRFIIENEEDVESKLIDYRQQIEALQNRIKYPSSTDG